MAQQPARAAVSIVCVYNDPAVLESCLARSVRAGMSGAPKTEFLPVDNREQSYSTAGAALNDGARRAQNDVIVFVHQDVALHSLVALEVAAARMLRSPEIGIIGAAGMDGRNELVGRIRDRVVQVGDEAAEPRDIDTLDEVLFMIRREQVLREPLSEDPILAWHAYGVEYCLRVRRAGLRAMALDLALTHNSLTTNLDKLDLAHRQVGDTYHELLPIRTTCGVIHAGDGRGGLLRSIRRTRGAAIWWNESMKARAVSKAAGTPNVVLADIRLVIDEAARLGGKGSIRVLEIASGSSIDTSVGGLQRFGLPFAVESVPASAVPAEISERDERELLLVTGLTTADDSELGSLDELPHVIGYWRDTGLWALIGIPAEQLAPLWSHKRNQPFAGLLPDSAQAGTRKFARR